MPASVVAKWSQHLYPDTKSVTTTSTSTLDVSSIVVIVLQAVVRHTCVRIFVDILYIFVDNIPQRTHSIHAVAALADKEECICLRSRPGSPNVVCQFVRGHVENSDRITE